MTGHLHIHCMICEIGWTWREGRDSQGYHTMARQLVTKVWKRDILPGMRVKSYLMEKKH